uniref:inorganic diphosphatase n=1 Tax=Eutreptiella gymnastica TaxID=73025 RepID=A0A7S1NB72_9EUGL
MAATLKRTESMLHASRLDAALQEFSQEVEDIYQALAQRAAEGHAKGADGARAHPTAYIENLVLSMTLPPGCLYVGHTNTDLDSVAGAVGAAELYDGRACLAQPPEQLNGEIMYGISYARTGKITEWTAKDIDAWRTAAALEVTKEEDVRTAGRSLKPFGAANRGSIAVFDDVFLSDNGRLPKVCMVDHSAPAQMVPSLKRKIMDEGDTSCLVGIIDHHALDEKISSKSPLFMDLRPWGSMSTILVHSFIRAGRTIPIDVARLLLCAILSDTVNLTSPTTTVADLHIVPLLVRFVGEKDHNKLAQNLFRAKTAWFVTLTPFEVVHADHKVFTTATADGTIDWGWATVEVNEPDRLLEQTEQLLLELCHMKQEEGLQLVFLSVVDLKRKRSDLLLCGEAEKSAAQAAFPNGKLFCSASRKAAYTEKGKAARACLAKLKIDLETCALDVGSVTSRKKEFKPMMDAALKTWKMPTETEDEDEDEEEVVLHVDTSISDQSIERDFKIVPAVAKLRRSVTAMRLVTRMKSMKSLATAQATAEKE